MSRRKFPDEQPFPDLTPALPASADPSIRVEQARINAHRHEGTTCAACGQRTQLYRRTISSAMAAWGIRLLRLSRSKSVDTPLSWVSIDDIPTRGGDYAKLEMWRVIEKLQPTDGRNSGMFRPTALGVAFFSAEAMVPSHVFVYNQRPIAFSEDLISIRDALGTKFDYDALMRGEW